MQVATVAVNAGQKIGVDCEKKAELSRITADARVSSKMMRAG